MNLSMATESQQKTILARRHVLGRLGCTLVFLLLDAFFLYFMLALSAFLSGSVMLQLLTIFLAITAVVGAVLILIQRSVKLGFLLLVAPLFAIVIVFILDVAENTF